MSQTAVEVLRLSKRFAIQTKRRTSMRELAARGRERQKMHFWALRDVTFTVPRGTSLGIIGHNGSGKSTALKVLARIYRPTFGTVRVNGSISALLEVGAGFHPDLTGRENIRLNATILGFDSRQIAKMMGEILEFADIGDHVDAPVKHYSSGMYVRLGFAVAVMVRPEVLIVDEVIAVGDEEFQRRCYDHLRELRRSGTTMLIVSHGLEQVVTLCDEAIWLEHGEIVEQADAASVVRGYLTEADRRESARSAGGGRPGTTQGPSGALPIRVTGLEFVSSDDQPGSVLVSGCPAGVRVLFQPTWPLGGCTIEVSVEDDAGRTITVLRAPATVLQQSANRGTIEFRADPLLLAKGRYRVRARATKDGTAVADSGFEASLTVQGQGTEPTGNFIQPGEWTPGTLGIVPHSEL